MNAHTDFKALIEGAKHCASWGGSFVLYVDGDIHDSYDTLDEAADMLCDLWADSNTQTVREFAPSGASVDVTKEAMACVESWCAARFQQAPWEVAA